jgi:hypothetical protein
MIIADNPRKKADRMAQKKAAQFALSAKLFQQQTVKYIHNKI